MEGLSTTEINGKNVEHRDVIHHRTTGKFGIIERIRILFGRKVTFTVEIYTMNEHCIVVGSKPNASVQPFFVKKERGMAFSISEPIKLMD